MKKHLLAIVALLFFVVLASGCFSFATKHFENDEVSFDYPGDWRTFSDFWPSYKPGHDGDLDAEELGGVADPGSSTPWEKYTTSVSIERKEVPSGSSLKDVYEQTYQNMDSYLVAISERTASVDGVTAYEKIYKRPHGEPWFQVRDVWLEKKGRIYILSCRALPGNFAKAQVYFIPIITSFHVK